MLRFKYKKDTYNIPTSLSEIKISQKIEFDKLYGQNIESIKNELFIDSNGVEIEASDIDVICLNTKIAVMNFSFFSGIPLEEVEKNIAIEDVLNVYYSCFNQIYSDSDKYELKNEFVWNNEVWKLESPELTYNSKMTFNELIVSKQIVQQMHQLGGGKWDSLPYLSAIFMRKEDEKFSEEFIDDNSERLKLMNDLPMDIAVAVAFFLANSMNIYLKISQYSKVEVV